MNKSSALVWIRHDFRITKNHALTYASNNHDFVSAFYIFKKKIMKKKEKLKDGGYTNLSRILKMNLIVIILILSLNYWRVINLFLINIKKKICLFIGTKYMSRNI